MDPDLNKKVVKNKKLQSVGTGLCVIIPKAWIDAMNWNQNTKLILEFLPHRKTMILSENIIGKIVGVPVRITDKSKEELDNDPNFSQINGKKDSDFIPV